MSMRTGASALLLSLAAYGPAATADEHNPWKWSIAPYLWAVDTSVSLKGDGFDVGDGKVSADDLFNSLDKGGQIVVETGRAKGNWSFFVDATYLKTSDRQFQQVDPLGRLVLSSESKQWLIDAAVSYWPGGVNSNGRVYAGIRYTDLDDKYSLDQADLGLPLAQLRSTRDYSDFLVGASYKTDLNDRWSLQGRADYAGGDSDGIFQVGAFVMYELKGNWPGLIAGYRYKEAEFDGGPLVEEYEYKGPFIALNFEF